MAAQTVSLPSANDIWASAAAQLNDEDRRNINFSCPDKRKTVESLALLAEASKQRCIDKKMAIYPKERRDSNPQRCLREGHQIAVNDHAKFGFIVEGIASIVESIFRYAAVEALYPLTGSTAAIELEKALIHLYAAIMVYLSKAKSYFEQNSAKRILRSGFLGEGDFDGYVKAINRAQEDVDRCEALVDRHDQVQNHTELRRLFEAANAPLRRMDDNLGKIHDSLEASKRTEILLWLSPEPYIQHHAQTKRDILQGTGQWLLSDPVFHQWKTESVSSVLWLHGIPGSGKSKLTSIVIEDAFRDFETRRSPPPAFFYCSRNTAEPARSEPEKILASLTRQLSSLRPGQPLLQPTVTIYKKREAEAFASGHLRIEESRDLIIQLAELYPLTIIVIDALDECNPETRSDLLDALEMILQDSANLIKVFVTSRNDQDIVFHLKQYPNLEISSERNSEDIANFVTNSTKELIRRRKLLKDSQHKHDMEDLIVQRVIKEASGMFRWASLQLQYLCSFSIDDDIRERLGKLPHSLETLYLEIYQQISTRPSERENAIFRNTLSWLLCAVRTMKEKEFLSAISIIPNIGFVEVSKDQVLEFCNNFVVFDAQMDTFRLAHLSVREFLEKHPSYSGISTNSLAAEICLLALVSIAQNSTANFFLSKSEPIVTKRSSVLEDFSEYSNIYWTVHCQLAGDARTQGRLKEIFQFFFSHEDDPTSPFALWMVKSNDFPDYYLRRKLRDCQAGSASISFVAGCFDFAEILQLSLDRSQVALSKLENTDDDGILQVCARHGSYKAISLLLERGKDTIKITEEVLTQAAESKSNGKQVMSVLLEQREDEVKITETVVKAAASNYNGKQIMGLLLEQRGDEIKITEDVVKAAAENGRKDMMSLLLEQRGDEIKITEEVVKAAAGSYNGKDVMSLLLEQRGDETKITEAVVKAAARSYNGKQIMGLLLEQRGDEIKITEAVVKAAAGSYDGKDVMSLLLEQRGDEIKITEEVIKAAAENGRKDMMSLLLEQRGDEIKITEAVVKAAAGSYNGKDVMSLLLEQRGDETKITENVVKAAAGSYNGKDVMSLLLEQRGDEIKITEAVVKAAAGNEESGEDVMSLLLEQRGDEIKITEAVVKAAAGNKWSGKDVMSLLLEQRGDEIKITEAVVKAAAGNKWSGKDVMSLLLEQRGDEIKITEAVVKAAAGNEEDGEAVMALLLDQRPENVTLYVTDSVYLAAATCGQQKVLDLLCRRNGFRPLQGEWFSIAKFYNAAKSGDVESIRQLLCEGAQPDVKNIRSVTPLWIAATAGHKAVAELLAQREDVNVNSLSIAARSPIFWPSAQGNEAIVSLLMEAGADTKFVDVNGDTAASIARKNGHRNIVQILQQPR